MAMVAMQAPAATGEALSLDPFMASAAAPGSTPRAKHDLPTVGEKHTAESAAADVHLKFFGFLEFDWDSPGSGGVPGFGPLPHPASQVALAGTRK